MSSEAIPNVFEPYMLCSKVFFINKSKTKYVSVGLSHQFKAVVRISGSSLKGHHIDFTTEDFRELLKSEEFLLRNLSKVSSQEFKKINNVTLFFITINNKCILGVRNERSQIYIGRETLCELLSLQELINDYIEFLEYHGFEDFYAMITRTVTKLNGDVLANIKNLLEQSYKHLFNTAIFKELIKADPYTVVNDVMEIAY
ncbi:hypothetical protein WA026_017368 [Henosepilachna vigintioctopunctata]|uniref:Uncharacterized protein n=1 Tax=Henosepilachna vigintioctopunctata TaxID=420089 RepID=A0AAW1VE67_9CUCU